MTHQERFSVIFNVLLNNAGNTLTTKQIAAETNISRINVIKRLNKYIYKIDGIRWDKKRGGGIHISKDVRIMTRAEIFKKVYKQL
jgi:hypothetical protein